MSPSQQDSPSGRVYLHERCGGQTQVSGEDFTHICDPFWPCSGTYCCTCATHAPLKEFIWVDTEEPISEFRRRVRATTPGMVKVWRSGFGLLVGAGMGVGLGFLIGKLAQAPGDNMLSFITIGGTLGAIVCYFLGGMILNRVYDVDYRRMQ